ncbi:MAG: ECF transporter S component, partial [Actinobacteria bacterium]|nr:ECF transporter S component [Actinomycetota bacterium]
LYPFFLHDLSQNGERLSHVSDAPIVFSIFGVLLVAIAVADVRGGRMDAKHVALLGVLSGVNAVLRLPGALAGASLMFILPILCGYAFGPRFGFLLGASSMAASGAITGGIGPWLPFQMWALGWVGGGAGIVKTLTRGKIPLVALALYGWVAGIAFGVIINLWFWPFLRGASDVSWTPGAPAGTAAVHYWRFYALTSLAWDSARALVNVILLLSIGRPLLRVLIRFGDRFTVSWAPPTDPLGSSMDA